MCHNSNAYLLCGENATEWEFNVQRFNLLTPINLPERWPEIILHEHRSCIPAVVSEYIKGNGLVADLIINRPPCPFCVSFLVEKKKGNKWDFELKELLRNFAESVLCTLLGLHFSVSRDDMWLKSWKWWSISRRSYLQWWAPRWQESLLQWKSVGWCGRSKRPSPCRPLLPVGCIVRVVQPSSVSGSGLSAQQLRPLWFRLTGVIEFLCHY